MDLEYLFQIILKKIDTIKKSIVIADFIQSPIIEIAGELTLNIAARNTDVEILLVDDYYPSDGFSKRLPKLFKWFDLPFSFKRIFIKNAPSKVKFTTRRVIENTEFIKWPKSLQEIFEQIIDNKNISINKFLKNLKLNDVDVGVGILSSIISKTKDNNPNYFFYKKEIEKAFYEFNRRYMFYIEFFSEEQSYDKCFIFNGRFASNKALLAAISYLKIDLKIFYYERSHILNKYTVRNHMPHDRHKIYDEINQCWINRSSSKEANLIAKTFFLQRLQGQGLSWFSFSKGIRDKKSNQIINSLIESSDISRKKIIFFTSSEDEFESLGEAWFKSDKHASQFDIIKNLSKLVENHNYKLFIRVHPNFKSSSLRVKEKWNNFFSNINNENIRVISPQLNVSSYGLLNRMDLVIVYGSTIGIEAAYLGKKVIVTGPSYYSDIKAKINVIDSLESLNKVIPEIINKNIYTEKDISESTLPYGYWCYKCGIKFQNFLPSSPINGKYFGKDLDYIFLILVKLKKRYDFIKNIPRLLKQKLNKINI